MPEEVLFKTERSHTRSEIADYLRKVADSLEAGDDIALSAGGDSVSVSPPDRPVFEVKVERETSRSGPDEMSVEFEIEWKEGESSGEAGGKLNIG